jgi:hypothetical protein
MKKIILFLILALGNSSIALSQNNSLEIIYDGTYYGISNFQDFKVKNSIKKFLYIQNGINYDSYVNNPNESGYYLKLNKNNDTWFVPHNDFLKSIWVWAYWENPPRLSCIPFRTFSISYFDTNIIFKNAVYWVYGWTDPDEVNYMTTNGGVNFFNPLSNSNNPVYSSGCTIGGVDLDSATFIEKYKIFIGYNWRYSFSGQLYRGIIKCSQFDQTLIDTIPQLNNVCFGTGAFIKINPFKRNYIYAVGNKMMLSSTGGSNFNELNIPRLKILKFDYVDSSINGISNTKLYRSVNHGLNWDSLNLPFVPNTIEISPDNNNIIYAGSDSGLYRSTDKGLSWALYNNSFYPSKKVIGLSKDPNTGDTIYVCTDKAVFKVWNDFLVNINNDIQNLANFSLSQNYPNPFNPTTNIKFSLPTTQYTILKVFDIAGREIATLVNEKLQAGEYEFKFDANGLSSGIYFYQLRTDEFVQSRKMVLTK